MPTIPPPNTAAIGAPTVRNPTDYAIVVGIDEYDNSVPDKLESLRGCVNDAQLFENWLRRDDGGGLSENQICTILSDRPSPSRISRPLKSEIEDAILALIAKHQQTGRRIGRRLYMWFSGHGVTPTRDETECAILMANARKFALGRAFPGRRAARNICHRNMFEEVVLFMDCCRSVTGLEQVGLEYDLDADLSIANGIKYLQGFAAQTSITAAEKLLPDPRDPNASLHHGVFTHALLEGLRKGTNELGRIDSASLERYVKERTQSLLPPEDNQRPIFDKNLSIDFGPGEQTLINVFLQNPIGGFQVRDGRDVTKVVFSTSAVDNGATQIFLSPRSYIFATPGVGDEFRVMRIAQVLGVQINVVL